MVPVMSRRIAMMALLGGLIAAGLGCRHIGGKCDCQSNPADAVMQGPTPPYPATAAPGTIVPGAPGKLPATTTVPMTLPPGK
jgi:hypothetical protein